MYDPNNPFSNAPGMMHAMGAGPKPANSFAMNNALMDQTMQANGVNALLTRDAWKALRPDRHAFMGDNGFDRMGWRTAKHDWRNMRPDGGFHRGQQGGSQGLPTQQPQFPATGNFQLPTYQYGG